MSGPSLGLYKCLKPFESRNLPVPQTLPTFKRESRKHLKTDQGRKGRRGGGGERTGLVEVGWVEKAFVSGPRCGDVGGRGGGSREVPGKEAGQRL